MIHVYLVYHDAACILFHIGYESVICLNWYKFMDN